MNKFLILTANLGGKDNLQDPPKKFDNCDYIAVVDKKYDVDIWEQFSPFNFTNIDTYQNRRNAKLYKILSTLIFSQYEYILWHDANHQLIIHPQDILDEYDDFELLLFNHPHRNCCYKEMEIINGRLDSPSNIVQQYQYYQNQGMPHEFGLYEMTCYFKKNNQLVTNFELMWWEQICKFSSRDQCSFTYCLWKLGNQLNIKTFNGFANMYAGGNKYFTEQEGHLN
jgi:hypothetical protein